MDRPLYFTTPIRMNMKRAIKLILWFLSIVIVLIVVIYAVLLFRPASPGEQLVGAAERDDLVMVKSFIRRGVPINCVSPSAYNWTPLHGAVSRYATNVAVYLIDSGADVNIPDWSGVTPLMSAVMWGDGAVPLVKYLIEHGANLDAKDSQGFSVFDYARADPPRPELLALLESYRLQSKNAQKSKD